MILYLILFMVLLVAVALLWETGRLKNHNNDLAKALRDTQDELIKVLRRKNKVMIKKDDWADVIE